MTDLSIQQPSAKILAQKYSQTLYNVKSNMSSCKDSFEHVPAKNLSSKTKRNILLASLGTLGAIAILLLRGKFSNAVKLAEHIDFIKASSVEEAIEFGKTHLGVKKYKDFTEKDLDVINWINEALVNVNNKMHGKAKLPKTVEYVAEDSSSSAYAVSYGRKLGVNKKFIQNLDDLITEYISITSRKFDLFDEKSVKELQKCIQRFKDGDVNSLNDKLELLNNLKFVNAESSRNSTYIIKKILANKDLQQKLIDKGLLTGENYTKFKLTDNLFIDLSEKGLEQSFQMLPMVSKILQKESGFKLTHQPQSPFRTIYHELGHLNDKVRSISESATGKVDFWDRLKAWNGNKKDFGTAYAVSDYAATSPSEFVAEVFAELVSGNKLPDNVMDLYKRLGGYLI